MKAEGLDKSSGGRISQREFTKIAKALADPRRFEILRTISNADDEMCCGVIVEKFPIGQSTVSHHLKTLEDADLVAVRREGQYCYFTARPQTLGNYIMQLHSKLTPDGSILPVKRIS